MNRAEVDATKEIDALRSALAQAVQLAEVAGDWNLDEVEIDGVMVPVGPLGRAWKELLDMNSHQGEK